MATIKDIAKLTGVSTATVSNVLNDKPGAAGPAKTREIFEVAKSLHYRPNSLAKSLKQQKTNNLGIITEDLTVFNTPEIVDGIDSYCEEHGYEIILGNMRLFKRYDNNFTDTKKHQQLLDAMVSNMTAKQVEGIIYVGYHCREISYLPAMVKIPFVYAYCFPQQDIYPSVLFDDKKAAYDVTNLLIQKGHRKIGIICGPSTSYHTQKRLSGCQDALAANHIELNEAFVTYGDWERRSGYNNTDVLLDAGVSVIFSFNDDMASGVYERCIEKDIQVGEDISLFGFDNRDISFGHVPPLSTVAPPLNEIGRKSAELILNQIIKHKAEKKRFLLPCTVYERKSLKEIL